MRAIAPTVSSAQEARCFCQCGCTANRLKCWRAARYWFRRSQTTDANERTRFVRRAWFVFGQSQSIDPSTPFSARVPCSEPETSHPSPTSLSAVHCPGLSFQRVLHSTKQRPMIPLSLFSCGVRQHNRGQWATKPKLSIEGTPSGLRPPSAPHANQSGASQPRGAAHSTTLAGSSSASS